MAKKIKWLDSFKEAAGKTVAAADSWGDVALIAFTDGTALCVVGESDDDYGEVEAFVQVRRSGLSAANGAHRLIAVGLISEAEADEWKRRWAAERDAQTAAREKAEYERLKAKFDQPKG